MDPWEQMEGEPAKAFDAFCRYRDMGPLRSLMKVAMAELGIAENTPKARQRKRQYVIWSGCWRWVDRVLAYDRELDRIRCVENAEAIKKAARRHAQLGQLKQSKGMEAIQKVKPEDLTPRDAMALIDQGVSLERLALGMDAAADPKDKPPDDSDAGSVLPNPTDAARIMGYLNAAQARKEAGEPPYIPLPAVDLEDLSEPPAAPNAANCDEEAIR